MVQSLDPIMLNNFMKVEWDKKRSRTACVPTNRDAINKGLGTRIEGVVPSELRLSRNNTVFVKTKNALNQLSEQITQ